MIYSLLVLSSPVSGLTSRRAAEFTRCVIARGHSVHRVFFLDEGTLASSANCVLPQDENDPQHAWLELARTHAVELAVCISSSLRYGMLDQEEAERYGRTGASMRPDFSVSGLGDLVDACAASDRVITFGG